MRQLEDASTSRPWDATHESPQSLVHHIIDMGEHFVARGVSPRMKVIAINAVDCRLPCAITLTRGVKGSARLDDIPEPPPADGPILVRNEMAAQALAQADTAWPGALITRRVPLARWSEALEDRPDDIKVVIDFTR